MSYPDHRNLSADQITTIQQLVDSKWHVWKARAWIEHAKRNACVSSVQYAALELRLGIEMLWWENLFIAFGGKLTQKEFEKCRGESTRLYKVIKRLAPDYRKRVEFTCILMTLDREMPPIAAWDFDGELKMLHVAVSPYLHADSKSLVAIGSPEWMVSAYKVIENGTMSIWKQMARNTGVISLTDMPPEVMDAWKSFKTGEINTDAVRTRLNLARPVLRERRSREENAARFTS